MISGEKIGQLIDQPGAMKPAEIDDITELVKKYPYCNSLYLLRLKGMALANDLDFEAELKITSIHAHDRTHLYQLIHSTGDLSAINEITELIITPEKLIEEALVETEETKPIVSVSENEPIIASELEKEPNLTAQEAAIDATLNTDILTTVIGANFVSLEISEDIELEKPAESVSEQVKKEASKAEPTISEVTNPVEKETIVTEPIPESKELSFNEWLRLKQQGRQTVEVIIPEVPVESVEPGDLKKRSKAGSVDALLNKFIIEEPRISKPVKEFYNPVKNAKESLQESDGLVSETLAEIHVLQKNFTKAISAYEKLILLYPEKKTFFASRIEKIREEIKKK